MRPKPMVEIGGRPILWHIMKIYSAHGINDFVICCGYKGEMIKEFFADYFLHMSDVRFDLRTHTMTTAPRQRDRAVDGDADRHGRGNDDRRTTEAGRRVRRRRDLLPHLRRLRRRHRHRRADRVPPRAGRPRHVDRRSSRPAASGQLVARPGGDEDHARSRRSRTATAAGSTAASSCSSRRCSTTSHDDSTVWEHEPLERLAEQGSSRRTSTVATGRAWTRFATRWFSRLTGSRGPPWKVW